jgi:DNA invertase Pin-like site-specific DNA recombinase
MSRQMATVKFYDFIDQSLDGKRQPQLHVYLRTSKANSNLTNVTTQVRKLSELLDYFLNSELYYSNNEWYFDTQLSLNEDVSKSGIYINKGLQSLLDSLGYGDYVLFADVSRITRFDITSKNLKLLTTKLFSDNRMVFTVVNNDVVNLSRNEFTNYAKLSNEYYQVLDYRATKGQATFISNKVERMKECKKLYDEGMTQVIIAKQLGVSIRTIKTYIKDLKKFGHIKGLRRNKLAKITSPEAHIE